METIGTEVVLTSSLATAGSSGQLKESDVVGLCDRILCVDPVILKRTECTPENKCV